MRRTREEEPTTAARLNGDPAVTLVVSKQSGENTVATADALKERLKEIASHAAERSSHIQIINDQSIFIKSAVHSLEAAFDRRQHSRSHHHLHFPGEYPHHSDLGGGDSDLHRLHFRA